MDLSWRNWYNTLPEKHSVFLKHGQSPLDSMGILNGIIHYLRYFLDKRPLIIRDIQCYSSKTVATLVKQWLFHETVETPH